MENGRQRLEKFIWFARVVKSRSLAARLVEAGHVRVNGKRTTAAAKVIAVGDVLTIALDREVRVMRITAIGERRGPYREACRLYEDLAASRASHA